MASVFQQLGVEAYFRRSSITNTLRIRNIVLFAPDIDIDVGATKIFDVFSDPETPYGAKANPNAAIKRGSLHMTIYTSPGDQALGAASGIFGSRLRLGQLDLSGPEAKAMRADPGHLVDLIQVDERGYRIRPRYRVGKLESRAARSWRKRLSQSSSSLLVRSIRIGLTPNGGRAGKSST